MKLIKDVCEFCDGFMAQNTIRACFNYKGDTIYVDNVPAWVCNQCHEIYYDAPVYKQLEDIAKHKDQIIRKLSFPLAEFPTEIFEAASNFH